MRRNFEMEIPYQYKRFRPKDEDFYWTKQFAIFKLLSYCFEEIIGLDIKSSLACRPVLRLIKSGDITKEF